jgi:asparagine synthase (glutamine-hydrolysing)
MAHSIESRVPFLDYNIVEFVLGLPDEYKIDYGKTKIVLRESMRQVLPEAIRTRNDKLGFVTPEEVWVRERGSATFLNKINQTLEVASGLFDPDVVHSEYSKICSGKHGFSFWPWRMVNFGEWCSTFNVVF